MLLQVAGVSTLKLCMKSFCQNESTTFTNSEPCVPWLFWFFVIMTNYDESVKSLICKACRTNWKDWISKRLFLWEWSILKWTWFSIPTPTCSIDGSAWFNICSQTGFSSDVFEGLILFFLFEHLTFVGRIESVFKYWIYFVFSMLFFWPFNIPFMY